VLYLIVKVMPATESPVQELWLHRLRTVALLLEVPVVVHIRLRYQKIRVALGFSVQGSALAITPIIPNPSITRWDGYWHRSPLVRRLCGNASGEVITTQTSRMLINYVNRNAEKGYRGFKARFEG